MQTPKTNLNIIFVSLDITKIDTVHKYASKYIEISTNLLIPINV